MVTKTPWAMLDDPDNLADFMAYARRMQCPPHSIVPAPSPSEGPQAPLPVSSEQYRWPIVETRVGTSTNEREQDPTDEPSATVGRPGKDFIADIVAHHLGRYPKDSPETKQPEISIKTTWSSPSPSPDSEPAGPGWDLTSTEDKFLTALPQVTESSHIQDSPSTQARQSSIRNTAILEAELEEQHSPITNSSGSATSIRDHNSNKSNTNAAMASLEDREEQQYFASWGQPEARSAMQSQPRTVILSGLPMANPGLTLTVIQSLIFFGAVERIRFQPQADNRVFVTFITGAAAKRYYDSTPNGVMYNQLSQELQFIAWVEISKDNEPVSSRLATQLDCGASRVVLVKNCPQAYTITALTRIAKDRGRNVEKVFEPRNRPIDPTLPSSNTPGREVIFRFASIDHAVNFRASIHRDEDFMESQIDFGVDPCDRATSVHYD